MLALLVQGVELVLVGLLSVQGVELVVQVEVQVEVQVGEEEVLALVEVVGVLALAVVLV